MKTETSSEMLTMLIPAMQLVDKYACPYNLVYTNYVGKIVYEDDWQIAVQLENGQMVKE